MTKRIQSKRILLDINVLFNDFLFRYPAFGRNNSTIELRNRLYANEAVTYIRRNRYETFVADFSIAKVISLMQQVKVPKQLQIIEIETLVSKNTIISLGGTLIEKTMEEFKNNDFVKDMEDALQFVLSRKHRCTYIVTFNKKDFDPFDISIILPSKIRTI